MNKDSPRSRRKAKAVPPDPEAEAEPSHLAVETSGTVGRLVSITLRLGVEQIAEARRLSKSTAIPYQTIIRRWIAEGATRAQRARKASMR